MNPIVQSKKVTLNKDKYSTVEGLYSFFFGERNPDEPDPTIVLGPPRAFFTSENPDPLVLRNFVEDREALRPSCKRSAQGDDVRVLDDPKIFVRNTGG